MPSALGAWRASSECATRSIARFMAHSAQGRRHKKNHACAVYSSLIQTRYVATSLYVIISEHITIETNILLATSCNTIIAIAPVHVHVHLNCILLLLW